VMPQEWYDRMYTIKTYQEDASALGRINAWHTAFNVAKDKVTGEEVSVVAPLSMISAVALALWGSSRYWPLLWVHNRDRIGHVIKIDTIAAGTRLRVPLVVSPGSMALAREAEVTWCKTSRWAGAIQKCPGMPQLQGEISPPQAQVPAAERQPPPPASVVDQARREIETAQAAAGQREAVATRVATTPSQQTELVLPTVNVSKVEEREDILAPGTPDAGGGGLPTWAKVLLGFVGVTAVAFGVKKALDARAARAAPAG